MIHPTAIVSDKAHIGDGVSVGPYAIIGENVSIGPGTQIMSHVVIDPYVEIGANCKIFQFAALGAQPQAVKFKNEETWVKIGDNCMIREFVTIHRGTAEGGGLTLVGNNCLIMNYAHIAHDCKVGNNVIMSNNATLAGHIAVGDHAILGGLVAIHQFVRVGEHAYIGGKSAVVKDIPPYVIASGDRATLHGLNKVGLQRHGFSPSAVAQLKKAYRLIFRFGLTLNEAIERVEAEVEPVPEIKTLIAFIKASERGITR
ncbi:acyl-ACP--UDP-N-acetylglucosamine O-acyltransferase [Desulfatitalea tepidiphila]|jgi:UDP-N-acetylglucosamine acyltransferase|uniref:acyl-ACP--UDP-N-acetylglucosamine O-acyltransferase n=1 Tax=Desulfatitalea tepidiphila TaxID=1185843 RepID=UPI0006B3FEB1|nr:acyl-ACP--UDP-N-acetylglucosamine O-acyltransferase [Desulfatitalea tepidiphila]